MSVHFCFNIFCSMPNYALVTLIFYGILKAVIFASPPSTPFLHSFMAFLGRNSLTFLKLSQRATLLWFHYLSSPHFCIQQMVMDKAIKNWNIFSTWTAFFPFVF